MRMESLSLSVFRTLHELEDELQREEAEDQGLTEDFPRRSAQPRGRGSSHGSSGSGSGSGTAPSGLDDDSALWNIQAESSEEN